MRNTFYKVATLALLSYFPALVSRYKIFYIAVFLVCWWGWSLRSRGILKCDGLRRDCLWLVAFFAYLTLTALWADYPAFTLLSMAVNSIFLLVWALSYLLANNFPAARLARIFIFLPYVVAGVFLYMYVRFGAIRPYDDATMRSIGLTGNAAGLWLGVALPLLLWLNRVSRRKCQFAIGLSLLLIAISQSRAAYALAIFSLVAHGISNATKTTQYVGALLKASGIIAVVVAVAYLFPPTRQIVTYGLERVVVNDEQVAENADAGTLEAAADLERIWTFERGWDAFTRRPILGVGYNNITELVEDKYGVPITSHNIILTLIPEGGWPSLIIFVVVIVGFFKRVSFGRKNAIYSERAFFSACTISMMGILAVSMVHPLLGFPLFYVVLAFGYKALPESVPLRAPNPAAAIGSLPTPLGALPAGRSGA